MKIKCYFANMTRYETTGLFSFYILPSLAIHMDSVFKKDQFFEVCFQWLCWVFTISLEKKENA